MFRPNFLVFHEVNGVAPILADFDESPLTRDFKDMVTATTRTFLSTPELRAVVDRIEVMKFVNSPALILKFNFKDEDEYRICLAFIAELNLRTRASVVDLASRVQADKAGRTLRNRKFIVPTEFSALQSLIGEAGLVMGSSTSGDKVGSQGAIYARFHGILSMIEPTVYPLRSVYFIAKHATTKAEHIVYAPIHDKKAGKGFDVRQVFYPTSIIYSQWHEGYCSSVISHNADTFTDLPLQYLFDILANVDDTVL